MRKWTVMIYMAGDNNLDSYGVSDLKEMKRVGSTDEVAIIAQFDRSGKSLRTQRYFIRDYNTSPRLQDDVVDILGETNTGSKEEFVKFLHWGMSGEFKAEHYLVIIWAHGAGTNDEDIYVEDGRTWKSLTRRHGIFRPATRATTRRDFVKLFGLDPSVHKLRFEMNDEAYTLIASDDAAKDFLDNIELKEALRAAGDKVDVLGMDACLMSMAELCYQVRANVGITVASQAQTSLEGWPYEPFLSELVHSPGMLPEQLVHIMVREFINLYQDYENTSAALAACRLDKTPTLAAAVNRLAAMLIAHLSDLNVLNAIVTSRRLVWADEIIETVDLYDFCGLLRQRCKNGAIAAACAEVIEVIEEKDGIILSFDKHPKDEGDVRFTHGLGIYFPQSEPSEPYDKLDFVNDPGVDGEPSAPRWGEFIKRYFEAMSR